MKHRMKWNSGAARFFTTTIVIAGSLAAFLGARGIEPTGDVPKHSSAVARPFFDPSQPREIPVPAPANRYGGVAAASARAIVQRGAFTSVQVNVDSEGNNILGDAANEPTITVDVTNPSRMAVAWRQFDTVMDSFRQAGMANTTDFGATWNARKLDPGQFRSDPVLASDRNGNFYFSSLSSTTSVELFRSVDGGATWLGPVTAFGGDKQWIAVDRTTGTGSGQIYQTWNAEFSCCGQTDFARSLDHGLSFQSPRSMPLPKIKWGTMDVGPDGTLYFAGSNLAQTGHLFLTSSNARDPLVLPTFSAPKTINLGGTTASGGTPNPGGLVGQVWIATDHSNSPTHGNIYVLGSVDPPGLDPLDVMFIRSTDGGQTWSAPVRVNDDAPSLTSWQWFAAMSVAPTGRIDVAWNDTRNDDTVNYSELFYSSSVDGGITWSANVPITPPFNHFEGYPQQSKIGDYMHMVSDVGGANLAFAATFNHEQDVYYVRIAGDCNENGVEDSLDIALGTSNDCTGNGTPDECETDCNGNGVADSCDILAGTSGDCTGNGVPDECETDCNGNGESDLCDVANQSSNDANHNAVPDECESILYVRQGAGGKQTGLNWTDAYDNLQAALAHADGAPGIVSSIWVARGRYVPSGSDRNASFRIPTNVGIYGGFAGNETEFKLRNWHRYPTILSGDILGNDLPGFVNRSDNSFHVVACENCGVIATLDGFIIRGGNADGVVEDASGGGININGGEPVIFDCAIVDNSSFSRGGGAFVSDAGTLFGNCLFASNRSFEGAALFSTRASEVVLMGCTIADNPASGVGAVAGDFGGTVLNSGNSIFWGNTDFSEDLETAQLTGMSTVYIDHSTVEGWTGQYGGAGNNGDDPLFVDVDGADNLAGTLDDNFRLSFGSPSIDTGYISQPIADPPGDLDAHSRFLCGGVDRGAYEFGIGEGEYECDGVITYDDIASFAMCMNYGCAQFDFDADGDVDLIDFGLLQVFLSE